MRLAKFRFVDPDRNMLYGVLAVALSVVVFAYSARFGQISILAYYGVWFLMVAIDYRHSLGNYGRFHWIIAFGVLALLSVFWSQAPNVTLRAGIQYMTHIVCALVAARTIGMLTLSRGVQAGVLVVLLYSLAFGTYQYDALDGDYSFVGAFESKNQLGFYASLGVYFAFAGLLMLKEKGRWRLASLAIGALSAYALFASKSATSIISVIGSILIAATFFLYLRFSPKQRKVTFVVSLVFIGVGAFAALNLGGLDTLLGVFGKDTTLTGRTYLWSQGFEAAALAPVFGTGYQGFWVQGFPDAERLWYDFFITGRSGFHFHNTYIETYVELGLVGAGCLVMLIGVTLIGHVKRLLFERRNTVSHVLLGIMALLIVRSFFEIDVLNPYAIGSFLLYYAAAQLATKPVRSSRQSAALGGQRGLPGQLAA
jgi:exopolysaccharide production protein ExoQ